jgi:gp32 DNA binding protein like
MTINRSALNKKSASSLLKKIQDGAASKTKEQSSDERVWKPTVDSNGNGYAAVRFLPSKTEDNLPFVKTYSHGFKVGSKWYIEDCATTIGENCPVCENNTELWDSGLESDKKIVRERKRRLQFMSNIIVIKDPKNPDNEGKQFLYSFGQKIFDKLTTAMNPPEEYGESPRDPFAFFDGCVVKIKIKQKDGFRNYDDTTVEPAEDLFDGDEEKLSVVLESLYDLGEFTDPKKFKPYAALKAHLGKVLGQPVAEENDKTEDMGSEYVLQKTNKAETKQEEKKQEVKSVEKKEEVSVEDDDEDLKFFEDLAAE